MLMVEGYQTEGMHRVFIIEVCRYILLTHINSKIMANIRRNVWGEHSA